MRRPRRTQAGFTFIEVMVSIGVFAVIAIICYATLSQYLKVQDGIGENQDALRMLQRTFTLMERDLRFSVNRPVRDENGESEAAFLIAAIERSGELFRVTVSEPDVAAPGRTRLSRVAWRLSDGELYRDSWRVLDRVQDSEPLSQLVMQAVANLDLVTYEWKDDSGLQQRLDGDPEEMPYGVELSLTLDNDRSYRRVFDLANGS